MTALAGSQKNAPYVGQRRGKDPNYAALFLRLALGVGFLSAVADRFGVWGSSGTSLVAWGNFHNFLLYTAKLNPWCPIGWIPVLGWIATFAEIVLGVALIVGFRIRIVGFLSGLLTLAFALAMSFVIGVHEPLNDSVFVFSAASFFLATVTADSWSVDALRQRKR